MYHLFIIINCAENLQHIGGIKESYIACTFDLLAPIKYSGLFLSVKRMASVYMKLSLKYLEIFSDAISVNCGFKVSRMEMV